MAFTFYTRSADSHSDLKDLDLHRSVRSGLRRCDLRFDLLCVGCIIMLIIRGIMAVFHGLKVLFFGHSSPPRNAHVDSSVSPDDIEKFIKAFENKM